MKIKSAIEYMPAFSESKIRTFKRQHPGEFYTYQEVKDGVLRR